MEAGSGGDPDEMTKLKRQIIASDKLLKKVHKLETTLKTAENALIEKENETLRGISKFCGCPPLVKGLSVPFSVIKTITLWRMPTWDLMET